MKRIIRITTIYNEEFMRVELKRNKYGVFTDKGYVPFEDIKYIDIIGNVIEGVNENGNNK